MTRCSDLKRQLLIDMTHGHELLEMLQEKTYTVEGFLKAVKERFGEDERFFTCHFEGLTAEEILEFFLYKGKVILNNGVLSFEHSCQHHPDGGCCHEHNEVR